ANNGTTKLNSFDDDLLFMSKTTNQMYDMFGLDPEEDKHLLRNEYRTTEVYTFNGDSLYIDNGQLSEKYGLFFRSSYIMGYHNDVEVYVENYKSVVDSDGSILYTSLYILKDYIKNEVYTFNGYSLYIDNGQLSEKYGLFFRSSYIMGYHNEVAVYVENYKSVDDKEGSFLNDAIFIKNFDDVPIMIDNY